MENSSCLRVTLEPLTNDCISWLLRLSASYVHVVAESMYNYLFYYFISLFAEQYLFFSRDLLLFIKNKIKQSVIN